MEQLNESINTRPKRLIDASNFLNYILFHTTKGEPNLLVRRLIRTSSGLETWRQLYIKYAGGHRHRQIHLLQRILHPQWSQSPSAIISEYYKWLEDIAQYAIETTDTISEPIKIAVVLQHIKGPLTQHLKLNISSDSKWSMINNKKKPWKTGKGKDKDGKGKGSPKGQPSSGKGQWKNVYNNYNNYNNYNKWSGKWGQNQNHNYNYNNQQYNKGKGGRDSKGKKGNKGKDGKGEKGQQGQQFQGKCSVCGKWGHATASCWYNNDPRQECPAVTSGWSIIKFFNN
eukprot:4267541-Amphidinium_carterae.1